MAITGISYHTPEDRQRHSLVTHARYSLSSRLLIKAIIIITAKASQHPASLSGRQAAAAKS
jgi:hypothetical protein